MAHHYIVTTYFCNLKCFGLIFDYSKKIKFTIMISKKLLLVLSLAFTVPVFAQDADLSLIPFRQGDLWGYAAPDKSIVITPQYEEANFFHEGYASAKMKGKYGYITKDGKVAIPFKFYSAKAFRYGFYALTPTNKPGDGSLNSQKTVLFAGAAPKADGYEICIDTKGKQLVKCPAIADTSAPDVNKPSTVKVESNSSTLKKSNLFDKFVGDYKMLGAAAGF